MNFGLLFKKCDTAREFVNKSKLERVFNIAVPVLLVISLFFVFYPSIPMPHLLSPVASRVISVLLSVIAITAFILRWVYKKSLDDEFPAFRSELEDELYEEYKPFYYKRAKDYIDVNAHFGTDNNQTRVIVGYKRNTYFSIIPAVALVAAALGLIFYAFRFSFEPGVIAPIEQILFGSTMPLALIVSALATIYIYYVYRRFDKVKRNYIGVTVESLRDDSYEDKLDNNYLYIMQNDEKLSKRAQSMCEKHSNGWVSGLFATWEDTLLFGLAIAISFFYILFAWYIIKFVLKLLADHLNIDFGSSGSSYSDNDGAHEASTTRLVLTGHSWNEYYEIDGRYITHYGRLTDYELHGREIWYTGDGSVKTVAFIETDGSTGSVMYASDWDGERLFERYEYKS